MKKVSTTATKQSRNISQQKLTVGLDLGDRNSWYCVLDERGQIQLEQRVRTTAKALQEIFGTGGPAIRFRFSDSRFETAGAPSSRFCEGGCDAADIMRFSCPAAYIVLTALITCTLSPAPVIGDCHS